MELDEEQVKKLEEFFGIGDEMSSHLRFQVENRIVTGAVDVNRIVKFVNAYNAFRDSIG